MFRPLAKRPHAALDQRAMVRTKEVETPGSASAQASPRTRSSPPAPRSASASPQCRKLGQVRRVFNEDGWSARFQFRRLPNTYDGPVRPRRAENDVAGPLRPRRDDAETDRKFVAASMDQVPRASRADAAWRAIQTLHEGGAAASAEVPGSASSQHAFDPDILANAKATQLRSLANRTPGIGRDKKTSDGKWIPKTREELISDIVAVTTHTSTQALPGRTTTRKRPASSPRGPPGAKKGSPRSDADREHSG